MESNIKEKCEALAQSIKETQAYKDDDKAELTMIISETNKTIQKEIGLDLAELLSEKNIQRKC